ncbi:hypothetical protein SEVIR_5G349600v4 [Setaria viridis]|uniref:F-box domain-containing protein n=1 Tax=Setaria viridis TaxID=4556 RepID=A0A4U6UNL5_SETVI|nr:FBD-associated F-box protein At5g56370-like [Setaria viridis]TKW17182.1 hypothetical protein SEVIR_5G349600v2 [Setaria viridis]
MESTDDQGMDSGIDRISLLPTEILHNILSVVRIRTVVRMRRLSMRWRQVCEALQFICLTRREFRSWRADKFARFVNNLLLLRERVDLHTFQLHWCGRSPLDCNDVRMWIGYAVKHNVKVLDVALEAYDQDSLPRCVFVCPFLEELNLQLGDTSYGHVGLVLPDKISLPSLKKLTLYDVEVSQLSLDRIIACSPGLEDLSFTNCARYFKLIDSKILKRLTLDGFIDGGDGFTIATPCLIHFECSGCALECICWRERPSLESAHIDSCGPTFDGQSDFTGILLCAKTLTLLNFQGSDMKVMLEKQLPACSVFENLETLEIGDWCLTDNFNIVLCFLQLSPRLKRLTLVQRKLPEEANGVKVDAVPINGMTLQCPLLETVVIRCSKDDREIHKMVNAMVANGVSLEKINVKFYEVLVEKVIAEIIRSRHEQEKEFAIFEKTMEENPEWVDDSIYARSDSNNNNNEEGIEDEEDDEWEDEDDEESEVKDEEVDEWEDEDDDESEDEDDEESEVEDDDLEEDGVVDNNEDGNNNGMNGNGVDNNVDGNDGNLEDGINNNEDGNDNGLEEDGIDDNEFDDDDF